MIFVFHLDSLWGLLIRFANTHSIFSWGQRCTSKGFNIFDIFLPPKLLLQQQHLNPFTQRMYLFWEFISSKFPFSGDVPHTHWSLWAPFLRRLFLRLPKKKLEAHTECVRGINKVVSQYTPSDSLWIWRNMSMKPKYTFWLIWIQYCEQIRSFWLL